jgi:hypothetical protein
MKVYQISGNRRLKENQLHSQKVGHVAKSTWTLGERIVWFPGVEAVTLLW